MARIIIKNGEEYPLPTNFTFREMNAIKRLTGLRAGELSDGFERGDTDALLAFAAIARKRATGVDAFDQLLDLDVTDIRIEADPEDLEEPDPLAVAEDAVDAVEI